MDTQVPAITRVDATRADAPKLTTTKSFAPAWKAIAPVAVALVITPFADAVSCRLGTTGGSVRFSEQSFLSCSSPSRCLGHPSCGGSKSGS